MHPLWVWYKWCLKVFRKPIFIYLGRGYWVNRWAGVLFRILISWLELTAFTKSLTHCGGPVFSCITHNPLIGMGNVTFSVWWCCREIEQIWAIEKLVPEFPQLTADYWGSQQGDCNVGSCQFPFKRKQMQTNVIQTNKLIVLLSHTQWCSNLQSQKPSCYLHT